MRVSLRPAFFVCYNMFKIMNRGSVFYKHPVIHGMIIVIGIKVIIW